jgi:hypothetical protein
MKQIRRNVFETNSSSTHSIAIPKKCDPINYTSFNIGEFGWGWEEADAADYLYTAIYDSANTESEAKEKIEKLKNILEDHGINYHFGKVKVNNDGWFYLDNGYIDHAGELRDLIDELLDDGDKLVRFLSGGLVFTGNDNSDTEERCFIERNEEYLDDYDWRTKEEFKVKNPYYMSNHEDYDWYWKGN